MQNFTLRRDVSVPDRKTGMEARNFSVRLHEQLEISEKLYGNGIKINYSGHDIESVLQKASNYSEEEKERVFEIISQTRRKYGYLFR